MNGDLVATIVNINLSHGNDTFRWNLNKTSIFTV
jgi:hypothetical protein